MPHEDTTLNQDCNKYEQNISDPMKTQALLDPRVLLCAALFRKQRLIQSADAPLLCFHRSLQESLNRRDLQGNMSELQRKSRRRFCSQVLLEL